jgi:hypothetical protein
MLSISGELSSRAAPLSEPSRTDACTHPACPAPSHPTPPNSPEIQNLPRTTWLAVDEVLAPLINKNGACAPPVPFAATTQLAELAAQHNTSMSQLQRDSGIYPATPADGKNASVVINCPEGAWSEPFGVEDGSGGFNGRSSRPKVVICAPGTYVYHMAAFAGTIYNDTTVPPYLWMLEIACSSTIPSIYSFVSVESGDSQSKIGETRRLRACAHPPTCLPAQQSEPLWTASTD